VAHTCYPRHLGDEDEEDCVQFKDRPAKKLGRCLFNKEPDVVVHTYNLSYMGGRGPCQPGEKV
jgi:hypothetical protein